MGEGLTESGVETAVAVGGEGDGGFGGEEDFTVVAEGGEDA